MFKTLAEGFALGLSTGTICLLTCTPIYLPYLITEKRRLQDNLWKVMEISFGRFFSYLSFGALAGWLGAQISDIDRSLYTAIAYILLSGFLAMTTVRTHKQEKHCPVPHYLKFTKSAFLMGVLTGINFCPSFLIALSKAVDLAGVLSGLLLFLGFFIGTTLFLIPLAFTGMLATIQKLKYMARIASILIALWFFGQGSWNLIHHFKDVRAAKESRIVDPANPDTRILLISRAADSLYFGELGDSLFLMNKLNFSYLQTDHLTASDLNKYDAHSLIILEKGLPSAIMETTLKPRDVYLVEKGYPVHDIMQFLRNRSIRVGKDQGARWDFSNTPQ